MKGKGQRLMQREGWTLSRPSLLALWHPQSTKLCSSATSSFLDWLSNWDKQVAESVLYNNKTDCQKASNQQTQWLDILQIGDYPNKTLKCTYMKAVSVINRQFLGSSSSTDTHQESVTPYRQITSSLLQLIKNFHSHN